MWRTFSFAGLPCLGADRGVPRQRGGAAQRRTQAPAGLEPGVGYELHKANGVRLDVTKTLDELGVEDGATLTLIPAVAGESFEPQHESLFTCLARVGKSLFEPVALQTAACAALVILAITSLTLLGLVVRRATEIDPSMADTWLGRIAAGDEARSTIEQLYRCGSRLHRETNQIGARLSAPIKAGPFCRSR
ncbi:ubiquitin family protein [Mycobacterium tilburgii]|uniref:hypothetical protein n=1 Tax=Mycobacterium tilburgii TaxID=44467 RepID=UPI0016428583|nr:hypothetical protein [Mycobacterium tilburgii]